MSISVRDLAQYLNDSVSFDFSKETISSYNQIRRQYEDFYVLENARAFRALLNDIIGVDDQLVDVFVDLQAADKGFRHFAEKKNRSRAINAIAAFLGNDRFSYHMSDLGRVYFAVNTWLCFYGSRELSQHWKSCPLCGNPITDGVCTNGKCKTEETEFLPILIELQALMLDAKGGKDITLPKYIKLIDPKAQFGAYMVELTEIDKKRKKQKKAEEAKQKKRDITLAERELEKLIEKKKIEDGKDNPKYDDLLQALKENKFIEAALQYDDQSFDEKVDAYKTDIHNAKIAVIERKEAEKRAQKEKVKQEDIALAEKELEKLVEKKKIEDGKDNPKYDDLLQALKDNRAIETALQYNDKKFERKVEAYKVDIHNTKIAVAERKAAEKKAKEEAQKQEAITLAERELEKLIEKKKIEDGKDNPNYDDLLQALKENKVIEAALQYNDKVFDKKVDAYKADIKNAKLAVLARKEAEKRAYEENVKREHITLAEQELEKLIEKKKIEDGKDNPKYDDLLQALKENKVIEAALQYNDKVFDKKVDAYKADIKNAKLAVLARKEAEKSMAVPRTSYARTANGTGEWKRTAQPTPGKSNLSSNFTDERLEAPVVDTDGKLFTTPFTAKVTIPAGTTLRYTTDGTTPTLTNGATSNNGRFTVNGTTTYRFRLFQEGKLPSQVVTRSYIYMDRDYVLPVVSVVTDPINLYDDSLGVYVKGVNGRTGNGQSTPCNWNMDWDRPVNFEYITPDGGMVVNQEVDFAMCGGWSRSWTPHSFKLKAGKIYEGLNSIDYPFFADKPYLKHKTLQIRNGGNDTGSRIKDAALQEIVHRSGLDVDGQSTQPVVHFINGEYRGMLNMREPNNKHFAYANYGIDTEEMDQFEMSPDSGYVQMEGDREAFLEWYALSENAADEDTYEAIRNLVDIDEYINYMAVEFYLGGTDWPQNNIKGFRPRMENGRFRFVLFDLDGTFATTSPFYTFEGKQTYTFDYIYDMGGRLTEEIEMVTIFLNMLSNESFRKQFIDTYCLVAGSVFEPSRCNAIIDEMAARTASTLAYEGQSPYNTANSLKNSLANRQNTMINALADYWRMELDASMKQSVTINANIADAPLRMNDMVIPTSQFSGTLFGPVTVRAEEMAGYRFAGWSSETTTIQTTLISKGSTWKYYDQGSLDEKNWTGTYYSASTWNSGDAPLGYYTSDANNSRGYNTILDYGTDANNKRPTYYFRHNFTLTTTPTDDEAFVLNYTVDDGMVVYINGTEAARYLMPDGTITYDSYASTYANDNPDNGTITLPASLFKKGTNVVAIEVHNNNNTSSDIYLDAELLHYSTSELGSIICTDNEYTFSGNAQLTAIYEPLTEEEVVAAGNLPVRINEISADNSIYVNEYYKKNDWIELYNTTSEPIDVAGMYLSDNLEKPTKYQIESDDNASTLIEPYGHLIVWADKLMTFTQLHASFKLDTEGGYVVLTAADESWRDVIYYEPHLGTESVGLYPDGSHDVYIMSKPTIGKPNTINSYAAWLEQPEIPAFGEGIEAITAEELTLTVYEQTLHIHSQTATTATVAVYTATGQQCMKAATALTNGHATIGLTALAKGTYIVAVTDDEGNTVTMKIKI